MLGAEEYGFGTAALVAIGCDMARQCHLDTCPTGIATQREDLRAKFTGTPDQVVAFFTAIAEDVRRELAACGARSLDEVIGRADLLEADAAALELEPIVSGPVWRRTEASTLAPKDRPLRSDRPPAGAPFETEALDGALGRVEAGRRVTLQRNVTTRDRSIGAVLAGALSRRPEPRQLPHVRYDLAGSAGQSLGAFAVAGMRITVTGEANDYVAKGLSGGTVVVRPSTPGGASHALAGNVCLFGATGGALHVVGRAGMRFAVRNSGARAVVEGIGAHGCEYMTGGTVVVLGDGRTEFRRRDDGRSRVSARPARPGGPAERRQRRGPRPRTRASCASCASCWPPTLPRAAPWPVGLLTDWRPDRFVVVEPRLAAAERMQPATEAVALAR